MRVRLPAPVWADVLPFELEGARLCAMPGVYEAAMNRHGAVWIALPGGHALGVKPSEFEVVEDSDSATTTRSAGVNVGAEVERREEPES